MKIFTNSWYIGNLENWRKINFMLLITGRKHDY